MLVDLPRTEAATREKILSAAVELLGEEGLRKLTQPQVAQRAGVRQSHVTYYFPRRADLVGAVAGRYVESAGAEILRLLAGSAGNDLSAMLLAFAEQQIGDVRHVRTLLGLLIASEEDAELKAQMVAAVGRLRAVVGHAMGLEPGHIDATLMQATLWGLGLNTLLMPPEHSPRDLVRRAAEQAGVLPKTKRSRAAKPKRRRKDAR